jgi:hypothetical protein
VSPKREEWTPENTERVSDAMEKVYSSKGWRDMQNADKRAGEVLRPPAATDEEREDDSLTLSKTGSPKLDKAQPSLFPSFKTVGKRSVGKPPKATRRMHR